MASVRHRVTKDVERVLGSVGTSILQRQCDLLGVDLDNISKSDLEKLAKELATNSMILVGRPRAEKVKGMLMNTASQLE